MSSHLLSDSSDLRGVKALEFGSVLSEADQDEAEANYYMLDLQVVYRVKEYLHSFLDQR